VAGFGIEKNIDRIGAGLVVAALGGVGVHAALTAVQMTRRRADGSVTPIDPPPTSGGDSTSSH